MGRRRDWDKVGREQRIYLHGSIPYWVEGWAPGIDRIIPRADRVDRPPAPKIKRNPPAFIAKPERTPTFEKVVEEDEFGEWTIMCLDYREVGGIRLPPMGAHSYEAGTGIAHPEFHAMKIKYACINIPQPVREALMKKHHAGLNADFGRELPRLVKELHRIARFRGNTTRGSTFTFEFEFKNKAPN